MAIGEGRLRDCADLAPECLHFASKGGFGSIGFGPRGAGAAALTHGDTDRGTAGTTEAVARATVTALLPQPRRSRAASARSTLSPCPTPCRASGFDEGVLVTCGGVEL